MQYDYYWKRNIITLSQTTMDVGETVNLSFLEPTEFDSQRQDFGYSLTGQNTGLSHQRAWVQVPLESFGIALGISNHGSVGKK